MGGHPMNETYEWLYDRYALPRLGAEREAETVKSKILDHCDPQERVAMSDALKDLCLLWGEAAFSVGLQLGLRLMAGQRADILDIQ